LASTDHSQVPWQSVRLSLREKLREGKRGIVETHCLARQLRVASRSSFQHRWLETPFDGRSFDECVKAGGSQNSSDLEGEAQLVRILPEDHQLFTDSALLELERATKKSHEELIQKFKALFETPVFKRLNPRDQEILRDCAKKGRECNVNFLHPKLEAILPEDLVDEWRALIKLNNNLSLRREVHTQVAKQIAHIARAIIIFCTTTAEEDQTRILQAIANWSTQGREPGRLSPATR
jgi:hypothetical protein